MKKSTDTLMTEIRERLALLESSLPTVVDGMVSPDSKLPFKALVYREALIWRMVELSRGAYENFEQNKLANAILLTRAAVETTSGLWYLAAKIEAALTAGDVGTIDTHLMRLIMGSKTDPDLPPAINVMNFVDRVEKDIEGFRHQYELLSEFSHPNWAGTALLYTRQGALSMTTELGDNIRGSNSPKAIGVVNLSVALMIFENSYNRITDAMPAFIELCRVQTRIAKQDT